MVPHTASCSTVTHPNLRQSDKTPLLLPPNMLPVAFCLLRLETCTRAAVSAWVLSRQAQKSNPSRPAPHDATVRLLVRAPSQSNICCLLADLPVQQFPRLQLRAGQRLASAQEKKARAQGAPAGKIGRRGARPLPPKASAS